MQSLREGMGQSPAGRAAAGSEPSGEQQELVYLRSLGSVESMRKWSGRQAEKDYVDLGRHGVEGEGLGNGVTV